jgi:hypothetical protein
LLERLRYVDAARKVVDVGSVGTRAWILLPLGHDDDPLFLQAKEARPSVLEPYHGKSRFASSGQRVVEGQRLMQAASDILLGWTRTVGIDGVERDFYVGQLWDAKGAALVDVMERNVFESYARVCGCALAKAHARSATRWRWPRTSAAAPPSTTRWQRSAGPTPTRARATTEPSRRRSQAAALQLTQGSDGVRPGRFASVSLLRRDEAAGQDRFTPRRSPTLHG